MKVAGIFWVAKKTRGFFGGCENRLRFFLGMLKEVVIFWGRQILKL